MANIVRLFRKAQSPSPTHPHPPKCPKRNPKNTLHTVELIRSLHLKIATQEHPPGLSENPNRKKFLQKFKNAVTFVPLVKDWENPVANTNTHGDWLRECRSFEGQCPLPVSSRVGSCARVWSIGDMTKEFQGPSWAMLGTP